MVEHEEAGRGEVRYAVTGAKSRALLSQVRLLEGARLHDPRKGVVGDANDLLPLATCFGT